MPRVNTKERPKHTLSEFKRILQCAEQEPDLNEYTGVLSMLEQMPPSKETLHYACAWAESGCGSMTKCQQFAQKYLNGSYPVNADFMWNPLARYVLLRIYNGSIYEDWPWGFDRVKKVLGSHPHLNPHYALMQMVLNNVKDIGNSFFFFGSEKPYLPWKIPFPSLTFASMDGYNHMIWPWLLEFQAAYKIYREVNPDNLATANMTDDIFNTRLKYLPWVERINKAAFVATYTIRRSTIFEFGRLFPDMFELNGPHIADEGMSWNPTCPDGFLNKHYTSEEKDDFYKNDPVGYVRALGKLESEKGYITGKYKYIVVPIAGFYGDSTSGRLLFLLAYSGSVILLPENTLRYHFSSRFIPWVHYVPYSYGGADLAEKVMWLRQHDELARQIAQNGRNFGKSYLRLEDYLCYAATALSELSRVTSKSDAIHPSVNASKESGKELRFNFVS